MRFMQISNIITAGLLSQWIGCLISVPVPLRMDRLQLGSTAECDGEPADYPSAHRGALDLRHPGLQASG